MLVIKYFKDAIPFLLSGLFLTQTVIWWSSTTSESLKGLKSKLDW